MGLSMPNMHIPAAAMAAHVFTIDLLFFEFIARSPFLRA
jgi:hypothetical protein